VKSRSLGVDADLLAREGAVSEACARAMAEGARAALGTTWALSLTGVAGPGGGTLELALAGPGGGTLEKPVGTVWLAIAGPDGTEARKLFWPGERELVRRFAATLALHQLWKRLRA
jgi:nicotinamide-nucleotide amidase